MRIPFPLRLTDRWRVRQKTLSRFHPIYPELRECIRRAPSQGLSEMLGPWTHIRALANPEANRAPPSTARATPDSTPGARLNYTRNFCASAQSRERNSTKYWEKSRQSGSGDSVRGTVRNL